MIFYPVWIDQGAPESNQTMWISLFFLCEQVGVALGIAVETVIDKLFKEWKYSFLVQSGMLILFVVIPMLFIPGRYFR